MDVTFLEAHWFASFFNALHYIVNLSVRGEDTKIPKKLWRVNMIFSSVLVNVTTLHLTAPCDHAGTIQHEAGQVRSALLSVDMQFRSQAQAAKWEKCLFNWKPLCSGNASLGVVYFSQGWIGPWGHHITSELTAYCDMNSVPVFC